MIAGFFIFVIVLQFAWFGICWNVRLNTPSVKPRLWAYATMKGAKRDYANAASLHPAEHEILLGVLKKVEAKNSTLLTAWVFVGAALLAAVSMETRTLMLEIYAGMTLVLIPFVLSSLCGVRQLDQEEFAKFSTNSHAAWVIDGQRALILDMLQKEALFRFSSQGAKLYIPVCLLLFVSTILGRAYVEAEPLDCAATLVCQLSKLGG
jgi:hypothetical protein